MITNEHHFPSQEHLNTRRPLEGEGVLRRSDWFSNGFADPFLPHSVSLEHGDWLVLQDGYLGN